MPELTSPDGSSPLSQKRVNLNTSTIPKIESLERVEREMPPQLTRVRQPMKVDLNQKASSINPEEKGSSAKIVIWVVIVIVMAIAAYLALKGFLNGPVPSTDNTNTANNYVTPVVEYISKIVLPGVSEDSKADSVQSFAMFNDGSQKIGAESSGTFDIADIFVQKYESFTRLGMEIGKIEGDGSMPVVNTSYDKTTNEITIVMLKTSTQLDIPFSTEIVVDTDTVDSLTRISTDNNGSEKFVIKLSQPTVYLLQVSSTSDSPMLYLDVKEVKTVLTVTPTEVVPSGEVTITPSMTPTITNSVDGDVLENSYSKNAQVLTNGISNNTASFNRFYYFDGANEFTYKAEILPGTNGKMPNVNAKLEGLVLTVEVTNLQSRNATASLNLGSTRDVSTLDIVSAGNTRTYTFTLSSSKDYRIAYKFNDTEDKQFPYALWIQIKH
jgi:hypothetical protein